MEILKSDFDAVSQDLENLSKGQDVELHATFNKFGKTANLQVHDAPTGNEGAEEKANTGLKLFKTPSVRQVPIFETCLIVVFSSGGFIS